MPWRLLSALPDQLLRYTLRPLLVSLCLLGITGLQAAQFPGIAAATGAAADHADGAIDNWVELDQESSERDEVRSHQGAEEGASVADEESSPPGRPDSDPNAQDDADAEDRGRNGEEDRSSNGNGRLNGILNNNGVQRVIEELELDTAWEWLETRRDDVSRNVTNAGRYLDDWFAGEGIGERHNQSYLRLKLNQQFGRHNTYHSNARLSGRIDLPRTAERWKLIFESEDLERRSLRDRQVGNLAPSSFTGAFRYEVEERDGWNFSHDVGLRARLPLDPFYRFRTRYGRDLGDNWYGSLRHRLHYFYVDGWGQDARLSFSRELSDALYLRIDTEVKYRHRYHETEMSQVVALHQDLGELQTLSYEVGIIGTNRPQTMVDNYFGQLIYRRAIYEDWLVLELVPQVLVEKEKNWKADPRLQLNLEVYFFDF